MKKESLIIAGVAILAVAAIIVYYESTDSSSASITPKSTSENCITLTRDQIVNSWLSPGWNKPDDPNFIQSIIFKAVSQNPVVVVAYPVDKNCTPLEGKKINMTIQNPTGSTCSFPPGLLLGETHYDFVPGDVDAFEDLVYFNFLRLIPQKDPTDPTKLGFKVQYIKLKGGVETTLMRLDTKPCPPFCPIH